MSRKYHRRSSNINAAVWLIGLGILWLTNLWWPGILILIGVSMLVQAVVHNGMDEEPEIITTPSTVTDTVESDDVSAEPDGKPEAKNEDIWDDEESETPAFIQKGNWVNGNGLLPEKCPACGGPISENAHSVEWLGERKARCPFCNTVINL